MVLKYGANNKTGNWYGVAVDNGYECETIFNSYSLSQCLKFLRRARKLLGSDLIVDEWTRGNDGLVWHVKTLNEGMI